MRAATIVLQIDEVEESSIRAGQEKKMQNTRKSNTAIIVHLHRIKRSNLQRKRYKNRIYGG